MTLLHRVAALRGLCRDGLAADRLLMDDAVVASQPHSTPNRGVSGVYFVRLSGGGEAFHKPFSGVPTATAMLFGQSPDSPPMNECAAWRLACELGQPWVRMVPACVLRDIAPQGLGSLCARHYGQAHDRTPLSDPSTCDAAAFFDALIGQQDRHTGNYRWDRNAFHLGLIDHGFAFARSGDRHNASVFLERRWSDARQALHEKERVELTRLVADPDLLGLRLILERDRAEALLGRARRMLTDGTVTPPAAF